MTLRFLPALAMSLALLVATPTLACTLSPDDGGTDRAGLGALDSGTFVGQANCGGRSMPISVWTMDIDGTSAELGIRDDPLFSPLPANPLHPIARVGYDRDVRFTLFRRSQAARGNARRLFATVCAGGEDPLHCSLGLQRVKIRVELHDTDEDGHIDRAYHQISVYDGASRLQVIYVILPVEDQPHAMVGQWIRLFGDTGAVDLDRVL